MRTPTIREPMRTRVGQLPTSRLAPQPERGVLAVLRAKAPRRALSPHEAARIAEWQATALLELANLTEPPSPSALIAELPRVLVQTDVDLPVSGCTTWQDGRWLIVLCGSEPRSRQRFSLAHEFKHAVDHRYRQLLYVDRPGMEADRQAELAADVFAASLLMPRAWVKRAWGDGVQRVSHLSQLFAVSPEAMARRLRELGLWTSANGSGRVDRQSNLYERPKPRAVRSHA